MEDILAAAIPATFILALVLERFLPGRTFQRVRWWTVKGLVFFAVGGVLNAIVPAALASALAGRGVLHLSSLGNVLGGVVAFLGTTLADYWLHRVMHRFQPVWRWTHQLHHAAERVDVAGFAYAHPLELLLSVALSTLVSGVLGVTPLAAMAAGYLYFTLGLFSHLNTRTPSWLGYIIQRPEMHLVHHQRDVHAYNYGWPLWDIAFGTFRNPGVWDGTVGFWDGASTRVWALLFGRDLSASARVAPDARVQKERALRA